MSINITMQDDDDLLNEALETGDSNRRQYGETARTPKSIGDYDDEEEKNTIEYKQWQVGANDTFYPAGKTTKLIPPGVYNVDKCDSGIYFKKINVVTDALIELPDEASEQVLAGMQKFWSMEDRYRKHGLLYKRGVLLWGPPGSGKTATLTLLSKYLIKNGGIVIMCDHPRLTSEGLAILRRIEPNRRIICIMEDIDEIIDRYSEHDLLSLLDGENQVDKIVMIATTNYPDKLGARIVNRPSRFDERILVDMPSDIARETYLTHILGDFPDVNMKKWVKDTDGLSIAHLREMAAAICCLDQDYDVVLNRLKKMKQKIKTKEGMEDKVGF